MTDSSSYCAKMSNKSYDQSLCHSLTNNTKEVIKMMHELWTTPEDKKLQCKYIPFCGLMCPVFFISHQWLLVTYVFALV